MLDKVDLKRIKDVYHNDKIQTLYTLKKNKKQKNPSNILTGLEGVTDHSEKH